MHIQEGTNTTLTTCTKMTEEVDRRHGVNGNSSSKAVAEDAPGHDAALNATGGRLKFFKDGKFILELVRGCARGGERAGWVSVPRKTFWPPAAPAAAAVPPCASLSVSDDNSSVQSSPWQRDHCWKQAAPRRHLSRELAMYYCRPSTLSAAAVRAGARAKRRRPHDPAPPPAPAAPDDEDEDRDRYHRVKLKKPYQQRRPRVYRKTRRGPRRDLDAALSRLRDRLPAPPPVNAKLASCRQEHALVSPRKRILRELERVSLEDGKRRARASAAPALSTRSYPPSPGPSSAAPRAPEPRRDPPAAKHVSSYSIHSLLSMDEAPRRSPGSQAALRPESASSAASGEASPSPEYRSQRAAATPPQYARAGAGAGAGYARAWPGYSVAARDEWPYCPYPYMVYRAPAPLWLQYAPPPAPSPWAPLPLPLLTDHIPKDEPTSDLPLNLSKH